MSVTIRLGTISKRRNSTKQPLDTDLADVRSVDLKDATSYDAPTFLLTGNDLAYNYLKWGNRYYFINDVRSVRHNLMEVECVLDALATYKAEILAGTQYVCYSASVAGDATWLPDTRIPVTKETEVRKSTTAMTSLFNTNGFYVLAVVGKNGSDTFALNKSTLSAIVSELQTWANTDVGNIMSNLPIPSGGSATEASAIDTLTSYLRSITNAMITSDFIGNAYAQAPNCIRSCIWVPFDLAAFTNVAANIWLGRYDTTHGGFKLNADPTTNTVTVSIPWKYSDWRRAICEDVYLYLPLVGLVNLSASSITHETSLSIKYSATASDGCVCYEVMCGNEIIGTYGGQCSANYPIGINQQASAGEMVNVIAGGAEKAVNAAINSSLSPVSAGGVVASEALIGISTTYDAIDTYNTTHLSCIGGIGGGAGVGLGLDIVCYTVSHPTILNPSDMSATMGRPVMKPISLSTLSGYTQCANAHVEAAAQAGELDAIDYYLNSGFYIE